MNVLRRLLPVEDQNIMWQRIVETFKWAYARRTELGDPDFVKGLGKSINVYRISANLENDLSSDQICLRIYSINVNVQKSYK